MKCINFKTEEELVKYLQDNHHATTKYYVTPNYINSIFGITSNGLLLYRYTSMVEDLYQEYLGYDVDDPYLTAVEWIDYNVCYCGEGSPIVVYDAPIEGFDYLCETDGVDEFLSEYNEFILGVNEHDDILIDDSIDDNKRATIEDFLKKMNIDFDFV